MLVTPRPAVITDISYGAFVNHADISYIASMSRQPVLTVRKLISLSPEMVRAIEDFRFAHRLKTEAEAIRRLIELGLDAAEAGKA